MSLLDKINRQVSVVRGKAEFRKLRNLHQGRAGLVVGNGPSLKFADLEALSGLVSIASNKIHLGYAESDWRPDYFTVVDPLIAAEIAAEAPKHEPRIFCSKAVAHHFPLSKTYAWEYRADQPSLPFSDKVDAGLYSGYTVTYDNLQLAVHLGLSPIYVIGCDHYFVGDENSTNAVAITAGEQQNHFVKGYRKPGAKVNPAMVKEMTEAYQVARQWSLEHDWPIFNATRGGHLEVFPRIDVEAIPECQ